LARALLERGHDVTLFTNYPRWAVERFGISRDRVRSFWPHGVLDRLAAWLRQKVHFPYPEAWLHRLFGRWAAKETAKESWDVIHCWSGVAEEILQKQTGSGRLKLLMRGSAHIRAQARLLEEEEKKTQTPLERPSPWMIAREEREYARANRIRVLSSFAYRTFVDGGFPAEKLGFLPLGASVNVFRPSPQILEARCRRILSGEPLRVLYVGALSFRKGMWDMAEVVRELHKKNFEFHFVGPVAPEASLLSRDLSSRATFIPKQSQADLPAFYAWGDIFVLPTIEDAFQTVLGQAAASALPILTTPNGAGRDLVREGVTGWVLPIRSPDTFIERLRWCDAHREELAAMVRRMYNDFQPRDWSDVAKDFEAICYEGLEARRREGCEARKGER
jgi:glycosyltransferase involved in cell wall biosynthesis